MNFLVNLLLFLTAGLMFGATAYFVIWMPDKRTRTALDGHEDPAESRVDVHGEEMAGAVRI